MERPSSGSPPAAFVTWLLDAVGNDYRAALLHVERELVYYTGLRSYILRRLSNIEVGAEPANIAAGAMIRAEHRKAVAITHTITRLMEMRRALSLFTGNES